MLLKSLKRDRTTLLRILVYLLITVVYYELYSQQWLVKSIGFLGLGRIPYLNLLIISFLCYVAILAAFQTGSVSLVKSTKRIIVSLIIYLVVSSVVIFAHEANILVAKLHIIANAATIFLFMFVYTYFATNERIKEFLLFLYFAGILFAIYTVLECKGYKVGIDPSDYAKTVRSSLLGIGPNALAGLLAPLVAVGYHMVKVNKGLVKLFYGGTALFLFYTVTLTMSRKGLLVIILIVLLFAWKRYCRKREIVLLAIVCCILVFANKDFKSRLTKGSTSGDVHLYYMASSIPIIKENPLFGLGSSKFLEVQIISTGGYSHNYYLRMAGSYGLVTLFFFSLFLTLIVLKTNAISKYGLYLNKNDCNVSIVLSSIVLANTFALNFEPGNYFYYWIWFGLSIAWARNSEAGNILCKGNYSSFDLYSGCSRDPAV
jgi:O-antigen ligase